MVIVTDVRKDLCCSGVRHGGFAICSRQKTEEAEGLEDHRLQGTHSQQLGLRRTHQS